MGKVYIHSSKVTYPPCRPFSYEVDKDGMTWAQPYLDKRGRTRYCSNPNHNHYYEAGGCLHGILVFFGTAILAGILLVLR